MIHMDSWDYPPLDSDLQVYPHQVGGHGLNKRKSAVLYSKSKQEVFKRIQKYPKGQNEVNFYELVFANDCTDSVLVELRNFVPLYKGVYFRSADESFYFGMSDLLSGLDHHSICDVKMGQCTFTPDASAEKIAIEQAKYQWQAELGFSITGMKIYVADNENLLCFDRSYGRSLTPANIYERGIRLFLGTNHHQAKLLARLFHNHLTRLAHWFDEQHRIAFYASSILLAYDQHVLAHYDETNLQSESLSLFDSSIRVGLIDFTRWCPLTGLETDENFKYGLANLLELFDRAASDLTPVTSPPNFM